MPGRASCRTAPVGAKIVDPRLAVIAVAGDEDGYGEGGSYFGHAVRRHRDITYLVHTNQVYALTKGQTSLASDQGASSPAPPPPPRDTQAAARSVPVTSRTRGHSVPVTAGGRSPISQVREARHRRF
ncbi:MAG: hypothetical protein DRI39_02230 [Chloroflexi bacterium]|nr:MAG: hypothetical protein DRI39_02230 [Chloroflexota bacterium]